MSVKRLLSRILLVAAVLLLGAVFVVPRVSAQSIPRLLNRTLDIHTSEPGAITDYTFSWRLPNSMTVGSVRFELCSDPYLNDACSSVPPGDFSAGVLSSQTGAVTGFSILSQTTNEIIMSRTPSSGGTALSTYNFTDMQNPTGVHSAFFVRLYVYASNNATGTPSVYGAVASATASPITINTEVPPILYFCAALTIDEWCANVNGNFIDYGNLNPVVENAAVSQFGAATNAVGGYVVTANGDTMTAGNRFIEALVTPTASAPGTPQFGINLRANSAPANGQDVFGSGIGVVAANYDTPDVFQYVDGDVVAGAVTGSMFNTYTVTYVVNIPPDQPSGVYNTTITYICTAAF